MFTCPQDSHNINIMNCFLHVDPNYDETIYPHLFLYNLKLNYNLIYNLKFQSDKSRN